MIWEFATISTVFKSYWTDDYDSDEIIKEKNHNNG